MSEQRHSSLDLHDFHAHTDGHGINRTRTLRWTGFIVLILLVLLGLGAARALVGRKQHDRTLQETVADQARVFVVVTRARHSDRAQELSLPGSLQGFVESPIYARSAGYLRRWVRDIGSRVKKGELLAEIDAPELDQQLDQAIAARDQVVSSMDLAASSLERWESLRRRDAVSQQELDERRSAFVQAKSNVAAAEANVRRLRELEAFKRIVAPYDGVITRRNVDVGDLIDAGNGGSASRALFVMAQTDPLRLYVFVPQAYSQQIHEGDQVQVSMAELSGESFTGSVVRTAGAIDRATRTLQVEINLPNHDGRLLPGAYVQVSFPSTLPDSLLVPTNTVMFRGEGPRIAVVGPDSRVSLKPVTIGRDLGRTLEVLSGVTDADRLVVNPPDSLAEGDPVVVAPAPARAEKGDKSSEGRGPAAGRDAPARPAGDPAAPSTRS